MATKASVPKDIEGFRKYALGVFVAKSTGRDLDQVMIDLGYTQAQIDKARNGNKATLTYTVTLTTNQRNEQRGRDYLPEIREGARRYLGLVRGEDVDVTYAFTAANDDDDD